MLVARDREVKNSSCSCVVGIGYVSDTPVGSGNDCVCGIMCNSSVDVLVWRLVVGRTFFVGRCLSGL